ncbi:hypothetical protein T492DRAFT_864790 [Pavlovales sp. CCMP2436]|nr:hypothetical protein T492DRAFT_864790 [Pavlovales sp. CCMP2436]
MLCWSERCVAHCLLRVLVGCAGLGATAPHTEQTLLRRFRHEAQRIEGAC